MDAKGRNAFSELKKFLSELGYRQMVDDDIAPFSIEAAHGNGYKEYLISASLFRAGSVAYIGGRTRSDKLIKKTLEEELGTPFAVRVSVGYTHQNTSVHFVPLKEDDDNRTIVMGVLTILKATMPDDVFKEVLQKINGTPYAVTPKTISSNQKVLLHRN